MNRKPDGQLDGWRDAIREMTSDDESRPDPLTADERATVEELRADAARQVQGYPRLLRALAILDAHFPPPVKG